MRDLANPLARPVAAPKKKTTPHARNKNERAADMEALQQQARLFSRTVTQSQQASTLGAASPMLQLFQVGVMLPLPSPLHPPLGRPPCFRCFR